MLTFSTLSALTQMHLGIQMSNSVEELFTSTLDTRAEVSAILSNKFKQLNRKAIQNSSLSKPSLSGRHIGQFTMTMTHHGNRTRQPVLVVKGLIMNLLGRPAIQALKIVPEIDSISRPWIVRKVNFASAWSYDTAIHNAFRKLSKAWKI